MRESNSYADTVTDWEELLTAIEQNGEDLPQLEIPRQKLQMMLIQIRSSAAEQAALMRAALESPGTFSALFPHRPASPRWVVSRPRAVSRQLQPR